MLIVNPGDVIVLTDEESLKEDIKGLKLLITSVIAVVEQGESCTWQLIETDSDRVLVIKSSLHTDAYDVKIMWESQDMPKGNKIDWVNMGFNWLFLAPQDEEFTGKDLVYTEEIFQNEDKFNQKSPTWYGSYEPDDGDSVFYAVHELASDSAEYGELIIFEGGADNTDGGYITFLQGKNIPVHDIEVLTRSEE
jgi:hypothetical protein